MKGMIVAVAALAALAAPATAAEDPRVAAEIMALARTQIDAGIAQKPWTERMSVASDDYTLFNATSPTRIDGKAGIMGLNVAGSTGGGKTLHTEMLNPKVQVYGDTAILTFNGYSMNQAKDGSVTPGNSKVTRVYVRQGGAWKNVHGHFSPTSLPAN